MSQRNISENISTIYLTITTRIILTSTKNIQGIVDKFLSQKLMN